MDVEDDVRTDPPPTRAMTNVIRDPRLRELIVTVSELRSADNGQRRPPAHPPTDQDARSAWLARVAECREVNHRGVAALLKTAGPGGRGPAAPAGVEVREVRIPVEGSCGSSDCEPCAAQSIFARVYRPSVVTGLMPAYVNFHGGAFWMMGGPDQIRNLAPGSGRLASELGAVIIDVDYRMAPEHKFPTPPEDCYTALRWADAQADDLGIDRTRIAIGGGSAGGALAAAVALMARDRGTPAVCTQVLYVPMLDSSANTPSMHAFAEGYVFTRAGARDAWDLYLTRPADAFSPYASPAHATDVTGLPDALVIVGDYDPLRDEGLAYAARLVEAGVMVTTKIQPQCHGAILPETAAQTQGLIIRHLRSVFAAEVGA